MTNRKRNPELNNLRAYNHAVAGQYVPKRNNAAVETD